MIAEQESDSSAGEEEDPQTPHSPIIPPTPTIPPNRPQTPTSNPPQEPMQSTPIVDDFVIDHVPKKKKPLAKRWTWSEEKVASLFGAMKEFKTFCDYKGVDFESDVANL